MEYNYFLDELDMASSENYDTNLDEESEMTESNVAAFECYESNDMECESVSADDLGTAEYININSSSSTIKNSIPEKIKFSTFILLNCREKKAILDWCMKEGLIITGYICPKCAKQMTLRESNNCSDGFAWICKIRGKKGHSVKRSVRTGSLFSKCRMNIATVLMLTHCWVYRMTHEWIALELDCAKATISDWFSNCRNICEAFYSNDNGMIGGENKTVEMEETDFALKKCKGGDLETVWIFGGTQKGSNKWFFEVVEERNKNNLLTVIKRKILPGTTVVSHCWKSYKCLNDRDFINLVTVDKYSFEHPEVNSHSTMGGIWRQFRKFLPVYVDLNKINSYLAEYTWRKSASHSYDKMRSFMEAIKIVFPLRSEDRPAE